MSSKTTISSQKGENKLEKDELEEEFLNNCRLEDLPIPKKELEKFQFEVEEVLKSGCNLQIAEYSLLQYDIENNLGEYKDKYNDLKEKFMNNLSGEISVYYNNLTENNNINKNEYQDDDEEKDKKKEFDEEAEEIFQKNIDKFEKMKDRTKDQIKGGLMNLFKIRVEKSEDKEIFLNAKREYIKKRDALIESALRLVKKIVNDENEYKKFHENYFKK